jgi:hypothetical protein
MKFDKSKFKVYTLKSWMMMHWLINPALAFNEIFLGQRVPRVLLVDKTAQKPLIERSFVPCPHCGSLNDARIWSTQNGLAFGNWFGLFCPTCRGVIPCTLNLTTIILLAATFPLWIWFWKPLRRYWLSKQPKRYANIDVETIRNDYGKRQWIYSGLAFGVIMYLQMTIVYPLFKGDDITLRNIIIAIPIWIIAGVLFGFTMKYYTTRMGKGSQ